MQVCAETAPAANINNATKKFLTKAILLQKYKNTNANFKLKLKTQTQTKNTNVNLVGIIIGGRLPATQKKFLAASVL
jgi:hypothetical protein